MGKTGQIVRLLRPANGVLATLAVWVGAALAAGDPKALEIIPVLLLSLSAFMMVSFMNCLNDLGDVQIDISAHPDRPLARGTVSRNEARSLSAFLLISALVLAVVPTLLLMKWQPMAILIFAMGMGLMYETRCKYLGIRGNINIGLQTGALFLFGASLFSISIQVVLIGAMAAFINASREIVKDVQDLEGDMGRRTTLAMNKGKNFALTLSHILVFPGIILSLVLILTSSIHPLSIIAIIMADIIFLVSIPMSKRSASSGQKMLKAGMGCAMIGFVLLSIMG